MRGSKILLTPYPAGRFSEATIQDTSLPGTIMQIQGSSVDTNGRPNVIAAAPGTDGLDVTPYLLLEDKMQGKGYSDNYVSGSRCFLYSLQPGDEFNARCGEVSGTGNSYNIGDNLEIDADSGLLVPYSATPEAIFAVCREKVTQAAGGSLVFVEKV